MPPALYPPSLRSGSSRRPLLLAASLLAAFSLALTLSAPPERTRPAAASGGAAAVGPGEPVAQAGPAPAVTASSTATSPSAPAPPSPTTPAATPASQSPTASPVSTPTARLRGPAHDALIGAKAAKALVFEVDGTAGSTVNATIDGRPVTFVSSADRATYRPKKLTDGKHTLRVVVSNDAGRDTEIRRTFTIDTAPPVLAIAPMAAGTRGKPLTLNGTTDAEATLTANGDPVPVKAGKWQTKFAAAPSAVRLVASDSAGNTRTQNVAVQSAFPVTRAVHLTARAWGYKPKREAAMALLRSGRINAIQVDIKDEDGLIGYDSKVPFAKTIGAIEPHYDTKKMIAEIHGAGGRVIGRLVAFRDPTLTKWAWTTGRRDLVLQKTDGTPFTGSYGEFAFPNFANRTVQNYNVDLAVEAANLGFDDVLYDYIRRPDGKLTEMRIPGLQGTPEQSVANTVIATRAGFQEAGVTTYLGVSVFGIAATRPREIAQDVTLMAPHVDYVAPMVYPSHWAKGEYDVADPNNMPYEIVQRSLLDFVVKVRGTNAVIVPWLQDFSLGVKYGPAQVRAQIKAAADDKMPSFILWNAEANYTAAALDPIKK